VIKQIGCAAVEVAPSTYGIHVAGIYKQFPAFPIRNMQQPLQMTAKELIQLIQLIADIWDMEKHPHLYGYFSCIR